MKHSREDQQSQKEWFFKRSDRSDKTGKSREREKERVIGIKR